MTLDHSYTGGSYYQPDCYDGPHRLLVAVTCRMGDLAIFNLALLDTGSEWCVLPPALARDLGLDTASDASTPRLLSRFGAIAGRLERVPITFHASEGENLTIEATCFVSADWPGPLVIGWKGCLERMRFAFDPGDDSFYFGEL